MTREEYKEWLQDKINTTQAMADNTKKAIPYNLETGNFNNAAALMKEFQVFQAQIGAWTWALEKFNQIEEQ